MLVELIIKSSYLNHYLKRFFVKQIVLIFSVARTAFLSSILNLKNIKHLKNVSEEFMHVARHQNKWLDWCVSEDKKKKLTQCLLRSCKSVPVVYKMEVLGHFGTENWV